MGLLWGTYHKHEVAPAYAQHVHEHRAPTDESVRLLADMEREARRRVVQALVPSDNHLSGVVAEIDRTHPGGGIFVAFTLNQREYQFRLDGIEVAFALDPKRGLNVLSQRIAETITSKILANVCDAKTSMTPVLPAPAA